jgi:hypothetical protein
MGSRLPFGNRESSGRITALSESEPNPIAAGSDFPIYCQTVDWHCSARGMNPLVREPTIDPLRKRNRRNPFTQLSHSKNSRGASVDLAISVTCNSNARRVGLLRRKLSRTDFRQVHFAGFSTIIFGGLPVVYSTVTENSGWGDSSICTHVAGSVSVCLRTAEHPCQYRIW